MEENNIERLQQERLLDYAARVFSQAVTAGNRISLADPQNEWIAPSLGGQVENLSPERYARMRVIDTADDIGFGQAQQFREDNFADTFRGEEKGKQESAAMMANMELGDMADFMYDDDYPEPVGMTLRINIPERNREDMREGQMTPPQATRMSEEAKRGYDNLKPLPSGAGGGTKNDY